MGNAQRAHHSVPNLRKMVGTALTRLCPPFGTVYGVIAAQ